SFVARSTSRTLYSRVGTRSPEAASRSASSVAPIGRYSASRMSPLWPRASRTASLLRPSIRVPLSPPLAEDDVHVWRASLDELGGLEALLSYEECDRAARFRFLEQRRRWVAARGLLRAILASYLDEAPERLRFSAGRYGKPRLDRDGPEN